MKISRSARLATLGLLAITMGAAAAQARDNNWYIGLRGGTVFPDDRRFYSTGPTSTDFNTTAKQGWAAAARLGYDFGRLRTEIDVGYHQTRLRSVELLATTPLGAAGNYAGADGRMRNLTVMANGLFDIINSDGFSLSAGAGAGAARINAHNIRLAPNAGVFLDDSDWVFAWNALAGARVALGPGVDLAVDYRYLRPNRARLVDISGQGVTNRSNSHTILVGLNFNFGEQRAAAPMPEPAAPPMAQPAPEPAPLPPPPPPPPMTMAPAAPAGPIILFFDFDSAELGGEARQLIAQAADPARQNGQTVLELAGHTDRAGTAPYNIALGQRRAEAVQRELESQGVTGSRISIQSFGEDRTRVDTLDGQREPQNRRVEITIRPQ
jgi:outer membrane protein OmpA-like peptidoglycan-associated protein